MTPDDTLSPLQRQALADQIRASRRELEALVETFDRRPAELFDETARQTCIALLRDLRATVVKVWHRVNSETAWQGALRGPIKVESLPPLLQSEIVEALSVLDVQAHFLIEGGAVDRLFDREFEDGTALELTLGDEGTAGFPLARLGLVLVPAERNLILFAGHVLSRRDGGEEWPKACAVHSKIGPLRGERWHRDEVELFVLQVAQGFHAEVAAEVAARGEPLGA